MKQNNGNSLAFIDMKFHGNHQFGSLINNTPKTGIFNVQNSITTILNFYFLNKKWLITYVYVGVNKGNFESCTFSFEKVNLGIGYENDVDCVFDQVTLLKMALFATNFCETIFFEVNSEVKK